MVVSKIISSCLEFCVIWSKIHLGERMNRDSGITVARISVVPVALGIQNRACDVLMISDRYQGGRFLMRRELTKLARRGGASAPVGVTF